MKTQKHIPSHHRSSNGKVAQLPRELRNLVNQALRDGTPYPDITARLEAQGHPGFLGSSFSRWKLGGYRQWLDEQIRFEQAQAPSPVVAALLGQIQPGRSSEIGSLNELLISHQLNEVLRDFDLSSLKAVLAQNPVQFFQLTKTLALHTMASARRQQVELDRLNHELESRKLDRRKNGGIRPATLAQVEKELKLL